jgi:hypothetical protein
LHVQSPRASLAAAELEPVGQEVQAALPLVALYLPTSQLEHDPPSGPLNPALHTHPVMTLLPAEDTECMGQDVHVLEPAAANELAAHREQVNGVVAATAAEKVPAGQEVQAPEPSVSLNFPERHTLQRPPFSPVYPLLQRQSCIDTLPAADIVLAGHEPEQTPVPEFGLKVPAWCI